MDDGQIDFVIDIPASRFSSNEKTNGYLMRQAALSNAIPLITNIKNARLTIAALSLYRSKGEEFSSKFEFEAWSKYAEQNALSHSLHEQIKSQRLAGSTRPFGVSSPRRFALGP